MNCKKCGSTLHDDDVFCQNCGARIEETNAEEKTAEKSEEVIQEKNTADTSTKTIAAASSESAASVSSESAASVQPESAAPELTKINASASSNDGGSASKALKKPVLIGICAAAIVIVAAVVILLSSSKSFALDEGIFCLYDDNDTTYIFDNGKVIDKLSEDIIVRTYSMDTRSCVLLSEENSLYYVDKNGIKKVASEVDGDYSICISDNSSSILYVKDDYLYFYRLSNDQSERIAENPSSFRISADGNSFLYTVINSDDETEGYFYSNGNTTKLDGKEITPIAIADNAKYVYYSKLNDDYEESLYVYTNNDSTKLTSSCDTYGIMLNKDCSEVIYNNDNGTYISKNGSEAQKISKDSLSWIVSPYYGIGRSNNVINVDTFKDKAFYSYGSGYDIRYLICNKNEWTTEKVVADVSRAYVSSDLKSVMYIKNDKLFYISKIADGSNNAVELGDDIDSFIPSADMKYCYAIDTDSSLYYIDMKNKKKISDDVKSEYDYDINIEGNIFFVSDDVLYTAYKNGAREKINGNECYIARENNCIFYGEENDDIINIYANTNGTKFECVIKDLESELDSNSDVDGAALQDISSANAMAKLAHTNASTYCTKCETNGYPVPSGWYFCDLTNRSESYPSFNGKDFEVGMQYYMGNSDMASYAMVYISDGFPERAFWSSKKNLKHLNTDMISESMQCNSSMIIGSYPYATDLGDKSDFYFKD